MSSVALWRELVVTHLRLALDEYPHPWWMARNLRIKKELQHRECPTG
jgi:hypothetical protein